MGLESLENYNHAKIKRKQDYEFFLVNHWNANGKPNRQTISKIHVAKFTNFLNTCV